MVLSSQPVFQDLLPIQTRSQKEHAAARQGAIVVQSGRAQAGAKKQLEISHALAAFCKRVFNHEGYTRHS